MYTRTREKLNERFFVFHDHFVDLWNLWAVFISAAQFFVFFLLLYYQRSNKKNRSKKITLLHWCLKVVPLYHWHTDTHPSPKHTQITLERIAVCISYMFASNSCKINVSCILMTLDIHLWISLYHRKTKTFLFLYELARSFIFFSGNLHKIPAKW